MLNEKYGGIKMASIIAVILVVVTFVWLVAEILVKKREHENKKH